MRRYALVCFCVLVFIPANLSAKSLYEALKMPLDKITFSDWDDRNCEYTNRCFPLNLAINRDMTRISYTYRMQRLKKPCSGTGTRGGNILPHVEGTVTAVINVNDKGKLRVLEVTDHGGGGRHIKIGLQRQNGKAIEPYLPVPAPRSLHEAMRHPSKSITFFENDGRNCRYASQCSPVKLSITPDRRALRYEYRTHRHRVSKNIPAAKNFPLKVRGMVMAAVSIDSKGVLHVIDIKDTHNAGKPIMDFIRFKNGLVVR